MPELQVQRRRPASRTFFRRGPLEVAPALLDCRLVSEIDGESVVLRITEVEAYLGVGEDPGSHAYRGMTKRNGSMFLPGGHLYVYRSYGIHWCANVVVGSAGQAAAVLLRAGEIEVGQEVATRRRLAGGVVKQSNELARGPGRLATTLGLTVDNDGADLCGTSALTVLLPSRSEQTATARIRRSTRTGVAGPGGTLPYRFFLEGEPTVSPHRPVRRRKDHEIDEELGQDEPRASS